MTSTPRAPWAPTPPFRRLPTSPRGRSGAQVPVANFYDGLAAAGLDYGPTFQGLTAAWTADGHVFAEVRLPEHAHPDARRFGIHPALLDAALHATALGGLLPGRPGRPYLPFTWVGVRLQVSGATSLRVRLSPTSTPGTVAVAIAGAAGAPVAAITALTLRPAPPPETQGSLFQPYWTEVPAGAAAKQIPPYVVLSVPRSAGAVPEAVRRALREVLAALADGTADGHPEGSRLVVHTRGGVAARTGEDVDVTQAAIWGLVRAAQAEQPDRFVLLDADSPRTG